MAKQKEVTPSSSSSAGRGGRRLGALAGQLKPREEAQQGVRSTMDRLDSLAASLRAQPAEAPATQVGAMTASATVPVEAGVAVEIQSLPQLIELIQGLPTDRDKLFAKVPLHLIRPSARNHRRFGLTFDVFLKNMPEPPKNWESLLPNDYVDVYWQPILDRLMEQGQLDRRCLQKTIKQLTKSFGIAQSASKDSQISTTSGYVCFDEQGQPSCIEISSGEQRYRGFLMINAANIMMDFKSDAASREMTPELELSRRSSRAAENLHTTGLSLSERLEALHSLVEGLIQVHGRDAVAELTNGELMQALSSGFSFSKANGARYFQIVRHPQSLTLIDLCDWYGIGLVKLNDIAIQSQRLAARLGRSVEEADVYALALVDGKITLSEDDITDPQLLNRVRDCVTKIQESLVVDAKPASPATADTARLGTDATLDNIDPEDEAAEEDEDGDYTSGGAVAGTPLPGATLADRAERAALGLNTPTSTHTTDDLRNSYPKSEVLTLLQTRAGWSPNKGESFERGRRNLYTMLVLLAVVLESPKVSSKRIAELRELARLKDMPKALESFREGLLEQVVAFSPVLDLLNGNQTDMQELLDVLETGADSYESLQSYIASKRKSSVKD